MTKWQKTALLISILLKYQLFLSILLNVQTRKINGPNLIIINLFAFILSTHFHLILIRNKEQ